ncbi:protein MICRORCHIDIA 2-like isoform X2 [Magnolia sinica]|uniref:protein MICRORCHIDIA 2-like isoform X2 n=1 Tax=Magnolia sinica TaxID=86752 RepID=UPI00265B19E6|nr:protein MICRORCHIDIA 2-like isoform X2 [Magnolia sinica]
MGRKLLVKNPLPSLLLFFPAQFKTRKSEEMPVKPEIDSTNIVDLGSSDDEDDNSVRQSNTGAHEPTPPMAHRLSSSNPNTGESRSFWRAGAYDAVSTPAPTATGQLEHARVHPKFLHSNATSHKWAFGAIAELLDNAVDEICNGATFVKVDRIYNKRDNSPALLFQDDGGGMDPECMRQCMSLGYSSKKTNTTIGQYGNGFKTSTMRLGADVIVFSRKIFGSRITQSIGLLSYTFLRRTGQDDILVPMVDFDIVDDRAQPIIYSSQEDWIGNFKIILEWSPFSSKEELMQQFEDIESHGTKVIVYNLWLNDDGVYELDFDDDDEDIQLRDEPNLLSLSKSPKATIQSHISHRIRYSLRAYASILYLRKFTNFHIILRGKPVEQLSIADELKFSKVIPYRPQVGMALREVTVETTIGFVKDAPTLKVCGFNVYHKNRLIMPFWKVLHEGSSRGKGVVGFLEANFIEPAHDKQDFERTALFIRLEMRLKQMILDYWKSHCHLIGLGLQRPGMHNMWNEFPTSQPFSGLEANLPQDFASEQPVVGLAANLQKELPTAQPIIGLAAVSGIEQSTSYQSMFYKQVPNRHDQKPENMVNMQVPIQANGHQDSTELPYNQDPVQQSAVRTATSGEGVTKEAASTEISGSALVDKICDENIQLFLRCEEHRQKESELKQTNCLVKKWCLHALI